jgi:hypothetical protein
MNSNIYGMVLVILRIHGFIAFLILVFVVFSIGSYLVKCRDMEMDTGSGL